jgi:hypothetical protein
MITPTPTPTPRTDAHSVAMKSEDFDVELAKTYTFARQLEREITELNERLINRQETLMAALTENQNLRRILLMSTK